MHKKKFLALVKLWTVFIVVATLTAAIVVAGVHVLDAIMDKAKLNAAMQTVRSTAATIISCQTSNVAIFAPNDALEPKNSPCSQAGKYAILKRNSTKGCIYNTEFVPTVSGGIVSGGAIQAGCHCAGSAIESCATIFQCDFATTGKCISRRIAR